MNNLIKEQRKAYFGVRTVQRRVLESVVLEIKKSYFYSQKV